MIAVLKIFIDNLLKKLFIFYMRILIVLIIFLISVSCSKVSVPTKIKSILKKSCNSCHKWNNFIKIKSKDKNKWEEILQRMIRKGARLNNEEYKKLYQYFSNR